MSSDAHERRDVGNNKRSNPSSTSSSSSAAAASSSQHRPASHRLYADVIHSIFKFCDLGGMNMAMRISKQFAYEAGTAHTRSNGEIVHQPDSTQRRLTVTSRDQMHEVATNDRDNEALKQCVTEIDIRSNDVGPTNASDMDSITRGFPRVNMMAMDAFTSDDDTQEIKFPAHIHTLTIGIAPIEEDARNMSSVARWMSGIGQLDLRSLSIIFGPQLVSELYGPRHGEFARYALSCIARNNTSIEHLTVECDSGVNRYNRTSAAIDTGFMRRLVNLRTLRFDTNTSFAFDTPFVGPASLHRIHAPLSVINPRNLDDRIEFPGLTKLSCRSLPSIDRRENPITYEFSAPMLTELDVGEIDNDQCMSNFPLLRTLRVNFAHCDVEVLSTILSRLPALEHLTLGDQRKATFPLSYLTDSGVCDRLVSFEFTWNVGHCAARPRDISLFAGIVMPRLKKLRINWAQYGGIAIPVSIINALTPGAEGFLVRQFPVLETTQIESYEQHTDMDIRHGMQARNDYD